MEKISNVDTQSTKSSKKKQNEGDNPEKSVQEMKKESALDKKKIKVLKEELLNMKLRQE